MVPGGVAQIDYRMRVTPDGGVETDADETLDRVAQAIDAVLCSVNGRNPIEAVAVTTYWHNVLGLDEADRPLTPIISWADTRPRQALAELRSAVDEADLVERTGCPLHASYLPAKLLWLRSTEPQRYRRAARWMSVGEYLLRRLTGGGVCSYSMASGSGLLDGRSGTWDRQLLELLGLSEDRLWPIADRHEPIGRLREPWKGRWPRLAEAAWFPALGDGACSNLGAGCTTSDRAALMVGTSGALRLMRDQGMPERLPRGLWRYHADRRRVLVGGALSNGGNLVDWLEKTLRLPEPAERERLLMQSLARRHGLTVLPFLAGERAPGWRDDARGVVSQISLDTGAMDLYRGFLEAVAYRFAEIDDLLGTLVGKKPELVATGGALESSPAWTQILADVLGRRVTMCGIREGSSRGAALMALEALGAISRLEDVPVPLGRVFEPDGERHQQHRLLRARHQQLYETMLSAATPTGRD
jgi:gluconokinase